MPARCPTRAKTLSPLLVATGRSRSAADTEARNWETQETPGPRREARYRRPIAVSALRDKRRNGDEACGRGAEMINGR